MADKALHAPVATGKAVVGNQVLPDGHSIAASAKALFDQFLVRLAGTRSWTPSRANSAPIGRFERQPPGARGLGVGGHIFRAHHFFSATCRLQNYTY